MTARASRSFPSLLVTGTVCLLAAGAHVLGGGTLPAPEISVALIALVLATVSLVLGPRLSIGKVAGILGVGQVVLHQALSLLSAETTCGSSMPARHQHRIEAASCLSLAPEPVVHVDPGLSMPLAHLLAAAVTDAFIARAEAILLRINDWYHRLTHALQPVSIVWNGPVRTIYSYGQVLAPWTTYRADPIRGPPPHQVPLTWTELTGTAGSKGTQNPVTPPSRRPSTAEIPATPAKGLFPCVLSK